MKQAARSPIFPSSRQGLGEGRKHIRWVCEGTIDSARGGFAEKTRNERSFELLGASFSARAGRGSGGGADALPRRPGRRAVRPGGGVGAGPTGAAIADAEVAGYDTRGAQTQSVRTDGAGTFAMPGEGVVRVAVRCRFCRTTTRAWCRASGGRDRAPLPSVAERRTVAVGFLENVPYSRVESAIALRPFALFEG